MNFKIFRFLFGLTSVLVVLASHTGNCQCTVNVIAIPDSICQGSSAVISAIIVTEGVPPYSYSWSNGGSTDSSFIASPNASTPYAVTVTDANAMTCTAEVTLFVVPQPTAPTSLTKTPDVISICAGTIVSVNSPAGGNPGIGCGFEYRFQRGGLTVQDWSSTNNYTTIGADVGNAINVQVRRVGCQTGCNTAESSTLASWTVVAQPTAPTTVIKTPNVTSVCVGTMVSVSSPSGGNPGIGCGFEYRFQRGGLTIQDWSSTNSYTTLTLDVGNAINVQVRRIGCQTGCNMAESSTLASWTVVAQPTAPATVTKTPNVTSVCVGTMVSVSSPSGGNPGIGCGFEYRFQRGGITVQDWSSTNSYATIGADVGNAINLQIRRVGCQTGCNTAESGTLATWTVVAQPTAPTTVTKTPDVASVCVGTMVSVNSPSGGNPGIGCGFEYRFQRGGLTVQNWSSLNSYTTTGADVGNAINLQIRRVGCQTGCNTAESGTLATWTVVAQPTAPTTVTKTPDVASVCVGTMVSVNSPSGGNPGIGCGFEYRFQRGGLTVQNWSSLNSYTTTGADVGNAINVQIRRVGCQTGCNTAESGTLASWTVVAQPTAPVTVAKTPNVSSVCVGTEVSVNSPAGGNPGIGCLFEYRFQRGGITVQDWSSTNSYTTTTLDVGTAINIQVRRVGCQTGCNTAESGALATWTVVAQPSAPLTVSKTPNVVSVCVGTIVSVNSPAGGNPGIGCLFEYRFQRGGFTVQNWSSQTSYTTVIADAGSQIVVQVRRSNCQLGCNSNAESGTLADWDIISQPSAPTSIIKNPNVLSVCVGTQVSANAPMGGNAGIDCSLEYRFQRGSITVQNWSSTSSYTSTIADGGHDINVQVRKSNCQAGCNTAESTTLGSWSVAPDPMIIQQPISPLATCFEESSEVISTSAQGGTPQLLYQWQYSANGSAWSDVTDGTPNGAEYMNNTNPDGFGMKGISLPGIHNYRCVVYASGLGCDTAFSNIVPFEWREKLEVGSIVILDGAPEIGSSWAFKISSLPSGASASGSIYRGATFITSFDCIGSNCTTLPLTSDAAGGTNALTRFCFRVGYNVDPPCADTLCTIGFVVPTDDKALNVLFENNQDEIICSGANASFKSEISPIKAQNICQQSTPTGTYNLKVINETGAIVFQSPIKNFVGNGPHMDSFGIPVLPQGTYKSVLCAEQGVCMGSGQPQSFTKCDTITFYVLPDQLSEKPDYFVAGLSNLDLNMMDFVLCPNDIYKLTASYLGTEFGAVNLMGSSFIFDNTINEKEIITGPIGGAQQVIVSYLVAGDCPYKDTLTFEKRADYDLVDDTDVCIGDSVAICVESAFNNVFWTNPFPFTNIVGPQLCLNLMPPDSSKTYDVPIFVQAQRAGCSYLDTLKLNVVNLSGQIVPWPDTNCTNGLYRIILESGVKITDVQIPPDWDVHFYNDYFFQLKESNPSSKMKVLIEGAGGNCTDILQLQESQTLDPIQVDSLFYDICAKTLLVPFDLCDASTGQWFRVSNLNGSLEELGKGINYKLENDFGLDTFRYFFFCEDTCSGKLAVSPRSIEEDFDCNEERVFDVNVFPNPAFSTTTISVVDKMNGPIQIDVFDLLGRRLISYDFDYTQSNNNLTLNSLDAWPAGGLILRIANSAGQVLHRKLLLIR
ncbi:MAG: T9SS type A sorting domain-containing protein [Saprospiraceae bacterium]|nr:T9SS type A sorting domain-containing protein [Saprospiraceae bacterium]